MARIFEKILTKTDKENGLKISGASLLPPYNAVLDVKDGRTGKVLHLDYKVSGKDMPIIRGNNWLKFMKRWVYCSTHSRKTLDGDKSHLTDMQKLTTTVKDEPFPSAASVGEMKVTDEQGATWTLKYEVKFSKILGEGDRKKLTITESFDTEPFPSAKRAGEMKVKDEGGRQWTLEYKVIKPKNKRVLSGTDWEKFLLSNNVEVGHEVVIRRDLIEAIKRGSQTNRNYINSKINYHQNSSALS